MSGTKDLTEKILEDYNDVFADIVNVLLFQGERRVEPKELVNTGVHAQYRSSEDELHEEERDVAKFWMKESAVISMYGIENQNNVDYKMPLRVFGYEGASYREQIEKKCCYPVVTLILYFGTDRQWNAPKRLKDLIKVPSELDNYVNDIRIHVCEVAWLDDETIEKFTSDFKIVAKFFSNKRKNKNYVPNDRTEVKHVDAVLKLLSAMTGDHRYEIILSQGKKVNNMCEVLDSWIDMGIQQGIEKGMHQGMQLLLETLIEFQFEKDEVVDCLTRKYEISKDKAIAMYDSYFTT